MAETLPKVSDTLGEMLKTFTARCGEEVCEFGSVLVQYITDHNDKAAFRRVDRNVAKLSRAFDRMIAKLTKWQAEALKIEQSVENFYGD